jgi:hypothetical protein
VPDNAVEQEFQRLRDSSRDYKTLLANIDDFATRKKQAFARLTDLSHSLLDIAQRIQTQTDALDACTDALRSSILGFDIRTQGIIGGLVSRAEARLQYYHYYFAKAYEFRLLDNYDQQVVLKPILDKMEKIYSVNNVAFTIADAQGIVEVYRSQLADITTRIVNLYTAQPPEKILKRLITLSPEEILILNKGFSIRINPTTRPEFSNTADEKDRRIVNVELYKVTLEQPRGSLDLVIKHSGKRQRVRIHSHRL